MAIPGKGVMSEPARRLLTEAGYGCKQVGRELVTVDLERGVTFFFVRARDVPFLVSAGAVDAGVTGADFVLNATDDLVQILDLDFAHSTIRYAAPIEGPTSVAALEGGRIATALPRLVEADLARRGVAAEVVPLEGAVELAVSLGIAEAVVDIVESGITLRLHGLQPIDEAIMRSTAGLFRRADRPNKAITGLLEALQKVLT
ncbi:MAG: ATP phosphoribosyltransferase [Actinomycetota bacterium]|nr:ATP phosphoribosyltransferase [Actinomycetota bacterium]